MNYQKVKEVAFIKQRLKEKKDLLRSLSGEKRHNTEKLIMDQAKKDFNARGKTSDKVVDGHNEAKKSLSDVESNESGSEQSGKHEVSSGENSEDSSKESDESLDKSGIETEELKQGKKRGPKPRG